MPRPVERPARPKSATQAKARAKARKAKAPKVVRPPLRERLLNRLTSIDLRPRTLAAKVPFVVLVIGSLGAGLGLTLWLSTDAAERSYQLGSARQRTEMLQQQKEALERDVQEAQAAPALAEAARGLGMIPTRDTAHLVQDPAGNWVVVGTPKPAQGVPPPPLNSKLPDEQPTAAGAAGECGGGARAGIARQRRSAVPLAPGPEAMVRTPDGATTLGRSTFRAGRSAPCRARGRRPRRVCPSSRERCRLPGLRRRPGQRPPRRRDLAVPPRRRSRPPPGPPRPCRLAAPVPPAAGIVAGRRAGRAASPVPIRPSPW